MADVGHPRLLRFLPIKMYFSKRLCIYRAMDRRKPMTVKKAIGQTKLPRPLFFVCVVAVALSLLLRSVIHEATWLRVQGMVQETRVVADPGIQTNWGGPVTWKAEYRVVYSVAGREYAVWTDSGIRQDGKTLAQLQIPKPPPSCWVRYDPKRPETSFANCH